MAMGYQASDVTAIDVLLEPDATMLQHSAASNARLLKVYPKGFALDATHNPHITLIQRFVRTGTSTRSMPRQSGSRPRQRHHHEARSPQVLLHPEQGRRHRGHRVKPTPKLIKLQTDMSRL